MGLGARGTAPQAAWGPRSSVTTLTCPQPSVQDQQLTRCPGPSPVLAVDALHKHGEVLGPPPAQHGDPRDRGGGGTAGTIRSWAQHRATTPLPLGTGRRHPDTPLPGSLIGS